MEPRRTLKEGMIWRDATARMRRPATLALPSVGVVWGTAFLTGLLTSTFSTLMIVLGSGRIGRDVPLSWMEVGLVALRGSGARGSPGPRAIAAEESRWFCLTDRRDSSLRSD